MTERSKITDPPETCRPSVGVGAPVPLAGDGRQPADAPAKLFGRIDPAKYIGAQIVRQMAKETSLVLLRDAAKSLARVMGLEWDELAHVLRALTIEFTDNHNQTAQLTS